MRALIFDKKLYYTTEHPIPQPKSHEALIRVTAAGICGTDIEITKGYMDFTGVPGHEFVGIVEQCEEKRLQGKRVVGEINIGCGVCPYCLNRMRNHCPNRSVLGIVKKDGVFADYITLPVKNIHCLPDFSVSDEEAVFVEPLAAAFEIMQQVNIRPNDKVCVLGDGRLGLMVSQVLSLNGCYVIAAGHHEEKLAILEKRGIETHHGSMANERRFDFVVDCTGSPAGLETACGLVKPKGTVIIKTTVAKRNRIDLNAVVIDELRLIGSRCGPFAPAIRALAAKQIDVISMINKTFSLEKGVEAFRYACRKDVLKVIITLD